MSLLLNNQFVKCKSRRIVNLKLYMYWVYMNKANWKYLLYLNQIPSLPYSIYIVCINKEN